MPDGASPEPTSLDLLKAVLDPMRLAVLGHAAAGDRGFINLKQTYRGQPKQIAQAIGALRAGGFLTPDGLLDVEAFRAIANDLPAKLPGLGQPIEGPWTDAEVDILMRFFADGRLIEVPSAASKRKLVLEKIVQEFEPGRRYAERDVNFTIQLIHPDYAMIRRGLIDEGFMDRADGAYWRIGGRYEQPTDAEEDSPIGWVQQTDLDDVMLRPFLSTMVDDLVAAANDPLIAGYMGDMFPNPYTKEDAEAWIDRAVAESPPLQFAIYVGGKLAGGLGAFVGERERAGTAEIGWWINPQYWGRGITTAAAQTLIAYLFETQDLSRLWAPVMAPNVASARVAEKAGMLFEGKAPSAFVKHGERYDQLNYGITKEQWSSAR